MMLSHIPTARISLLSFSALLCAFLPSLSSLGPDASPLAPTPSARRRLASVVGHRKGYFGVSYAGQNAGLRYDTKRNLR
jgi:hypothetical protein